MDESRVESGALPAGEPGAAGEAGLAALRAELAEARGVIAALERRQKIDALLAESEAVDLEAARLLTEHAVSGMAAPDLALAVSDLRRQRPYLFRRRSEPGALGMGAREVAGVSPLEEAAERAVATGHRRDVLAYLRLRRGR